MYIDPSRSKCRSDAEQQRGQDGNRSGEQQDAAVGRQVDRECRIAGGYHVEQRTTGKPPDGHAQNSSE